MITTYQIIQSVFGKSQTDVVESGDKFRRQTYWQEVDCDQSHLLCMSEDGWQKTVGEKIEGKTSGIMATNHG
jgi:hypothetical protein